MENELETRKTGAMRTNVEAKAPSRPGEGGSQPVPDQFGQSTERRVNLPEITKPVFVSVISKSNSMAVIDAFGCGCPSSIFIAFLRVIFSAWHNTSTIHKYSRNVY